MRQDALSIWSEKNHNQPGFFSDGDNNFLNGAVTAHTEWLPGVTKAFSTTCAVHRIVGVGGSPAVVDQWQSTGGSSQRCSGFNSRQLTPFSLVSICAS